MAPPTLHSPWEYHRYRLWDDEALPWPQKREFLGNNLHDYLLARVSAMEDAPALRYKARAYRILEDAGIPVPKTFALYRPRVPVEGVSVVESPERLREFLRDEVEYPFFFKPISSHQSVGAGMARTFDRASDRIESFGEGWVEVDELVRRFDAFHGRGSRSQVLQPDAGYLLQEVVRPHPEIARRCGEVAAGMRVYVVIDDRGPHIFASPLKIPAPGVPADNFYRPGALLADVNVATGELGRVVRGFGADQEVLDRNPYTGERLTGWRLPLYDEMRRMVLCGAMVFPRIRYQGWDVAIGPDGPVTIELNAASSFRLAQFASGRGIGTPAFREALRRAEALNVDQPKPCAISWGRSDSVWRLRGVVDIAALPFRRRPT